MFREPGTPKPTELTPDEKYARERGNSIKDRQEVAQRLITEINKLLGDMTDTDGTGGMTFIASDSYPHSSNKSDRMSYLYVGREQLEDDSTSYSITMPAVGFGGSGQFEIPVKDGEIQPPKTLERDRDKAYTREARLGEMESFLSLAFNPRNLSREFIKYDPDTEEVEETRRGFEIVKKKSFRQRMRKLGRGVTALWNYED